MDSTLSGTTNSDSTIDGGRLADFTENRSLKSYEDSLMAIPNLAPEILQSMLSLGKKTFALEERLNMHDNNAIISFEKNKDLFEFMSHQSREIYERDDKIMKLELELAEKDQIIQNLRGQRQVAAENVVDKPVDNTGDENLEEKSIQKAGNKPENLAESSTDKVDQPKRGRGRPRKSEHLNSRQKDDEQSPALPRKRGRPSKHHGNALEDRRE